MKQTACYLVLLLPVALVTASEPIPELPPPRPVPVANPEPSPFPNLPKASGPQLPPIPEPPSFALDLAALRREAERLRQEREALAGDRAKPSSESPQSSEDVAQLRKRLAELVLKINSRPTPQPRGKTKELMPANKVERRPSEAPRAMEPIVPAVSAGDARLGDPLLAAQALFRGADYAAALAIYRQLDLEGLTKEERTLVQYMSACCLRKLGRLEDAAALYREVASAKEDEVLTDCSLWHLSALGWRRDMEKQLDDLRHRRQNSN